MVENIIFSVLFNWSHIDLYIYIYIYACMNLGKHPSFFDNPKSANCLLYLTCLMVNLLYFLINPSPSHPRVEEFEMAKNYAFSYSPENSCILGDLSLRRHAWACEPIKSRIWSTIRKMTCLYIYIWLDLSLVRECIPVICSCSLRFQRFVQHQVLPLAVCGSCGAGRECRGLQGDARRDHGGSRGWPPWYHDIRCWKRITMGGFSIV